MLEGDEQQQRELSEPGNPKVIVINALLLLSKTLGHDLLIMMKPLVITCKP